MGLMSGLGIGLLFIAPWIAMNVAYAMRPRALAIIDGGYAVVGCGVIGLVLGIFKKMEGSDPPEPSSPHAFLSTTRVLI